MKRFIVTIQILWLFSILAVDAQRNRDKVLLREVQVLTLYKGQYTTGRRSNPVPQIKCVGGNACRDIQPEVIQCRQVGWDGREAQWECKAELEDMYRLGKTIVNCEGYDYPDDPYILAGSCGVEYDLHRTAKYRAQTGTNHRQDQTAPPPLFTGGLLSWLLNSSLTSWITNNPLTSWVHRFPFSILFGSSSSSFRREDCEFDILFRTFYNYGLEHGARRLVRQSRRVAVMVIRLLKSVIDSVLKSCLGGGSRSGSGRSSQSTYGDGPGGGSGGGGGGGPSAPPYEPPPPYSPQSDNSAHSTNRPGFWSGLGLGGLLGSRMSANRNYSRTRYPNAYDEPTSSSSSSPSSSSWSRPSTSSSSSSSQRRTTTGYGGTKRR
ncbi:uncharacterized protein SPPG_02718 [Spizellomyces punctatus DAOM BR117]|uniref:Store-operated calcium entry-associated regulatory factor n=1 Tax=Spizellomyces punctatus (strain DAOM BR117) TaxID=645134 RepID=A0A0L0HMB2_SPIPD|nr:uncharacterized protein SPPG_02718 [Spizellomyces punctatus DAOM BR117]KND02237.1 hypothetical protein SPPG_02718 [Spizellomyces punctatus DAOM BR117]|eukprot:XP_016610276.1 hypothetical protein SPPG_02718 [Spizellomyces punctatus DAOM BR117]